MINEFNVIIFILAIIGITHIYNTVQNQEKINIEIENKIRHLQNDIESLIIRIRYIESDIKNL